jgi:hypothetical protein
MTTRGLSWRSSTQAGFDEMSAYDRAAWDACIKAVYDSRVRCLVPPRVRELTGKAGKVVSAGYEKLPGHEQADWVLEKAFDGGDGVAVPTHPADDAASNLGSAEASLAGQRDRTLLQGARLHPHQEEARAGRPVAGAVLNAAANAGLVNQSFRRAETVYRLRFLSEKYDIDPAEWCREFPIGSDEVEDVVQVDEELEAEIEGDQGSESA